MSCERLHPEGNPPTPRVHHAPKHPQAHRRMGSLRTVVFQTGSLPTPKWGRIGAERQGLLPPQGRPHRNTCRQVGVGSPGSRTTAQLQNAGVRLKSTLNQVAISAIFGTATIAANIPGGSTVALVSLTVTARAFSYTDVHCPKCNRRVLALPGSHLLEVRLVASESERSGRGAVVSCRRCKSLVEAISHR